MATSVLTVVSDFKNATVLMRPRARGDLLRLLPARRQATARVRAAFALTISGGSVLCGAMAKPGTLRSSTIIEERRHEHQA